MAIAPDPNHPDLAATPVEWNQALSAELVRVPARCRNRSSAGIRMRPHRHLGWEMLYCRKGAGVFAFDGRPIPYAAGWVFLFQSEIAHATLVDAPYDRWNLCFLPNRVAPAAGADTLTRDDFAAGSARALRTYRLPPADEAGVERLFAEVDRLCADRSTRLAAKLLPLRLAELLIVLGEIGESAPPFGVSGGAESAASRRHMSDLLNFIETSLDQDLNVPRLAARFHYSVPHLHRIFRETTGYSPAAYVRYRRMERAKELLCAGDLSILEVAQSVGIEGASQFARAFRQATGAAPTHFRSAR